MAKLVTILLLTAQDLMIDGQPVKGEPGQVYEVEAKDAKGLLKAKAADDSPINIAYHRGDLEQYQRLLDEAKTAKPAAPAVDDLVSAAADEKQAANVEAN